MSSPNYHETSVTGQSWQRCYQVVLENPRSGVPIVRFDEEQVFSLDGMQEVRKVLGVLSVPFDPNKEIEVLDPQNGEPTGQTVTYGQVYAIVYSAYIGAAKERDEANKPEPESE